MEIVCFNYKVWVERRKIIVSIVISKCVRIFVLCEDLDDFEGGVILM